MAEVEPNSPEAQRAAQKIRNLFFAIAGLNLLVIAVVLWPKATPPAAPSTTTASAAADPETVRMEETVERILAAYRVRDAERFANEFSAAASPKVDEEYFRTVIIGDYDARFGEILSRQRQASPAPLEANAAGGATLEHAIETKKVPQARMKTRLVREGDGYKALSWELTAP